jgi:SAM-dependent methyltransferase
MPGFRDYFSAQAARYAEFRPHYPPALVDALANLVTPEVAWDIGCGSGQLTIALAERFAHVIATDPSEAQLAGAPPHPRVEYRCVTAETSGLADASIDLAVAAQAAHWFDWPRFVVEVGRVTKLGGVIALATYGNPILDGEAGTLVTHYHDVTTHSYWPSGRVHVMNAYRDLVLPWPSISAPAIDMQVEWSRDELLGYVSSWSATARMIAAVGPAQFEELCERVAQVWPDDERRVVRWPLTIKLARR